MASSGTNRLLDPSACDANPGIDLEDLGCGGSGEVNNITTFTKSMSVINDACHPMLSSLKSKFQLSGDERSDAYGWRGPY